jgi:O-antigen ligase
LAAWLIIFAGHMAYTAIVSDAALVMVMASALLLAAVVVAPQLRNDFLKARGLVWVVAPFAVTIGVAALTLTDVVKSAVHPIWAYSGISPGRISVDPSSTIVEIIKLLGMGCLFLVGTATGISGRRLRYAINILLIFGAVLAVWSVAGHLTHTISETHPWRLEGHFLHPNTAGTFFAVMLVVALTKISPSLKARAKDRALLVSVYGSGALLFVVSLLMTQSRGAAAAGMAGILFVGVASLTEGGVKQRRSVWIGLAVGAAVVVALFFAGNQLIDRLLAAQQDSALRSEIWRRHFEAFQAAPWFGYGLGTSETVHRTLLSVSNFGTFGTVHSIYNVYLQWLEQAGIVGAAPMFLTIAAIVVQLIGGWTASQRSRWALTGLIAVDVVFLVHGASDFALESSSMAMMWAYLLGLQFSAAQASERS